MSLQILTIEDLFAGKKPTMPPEDPAAFRKAAREERLVASALVDLNRLAGYDPPAW